MLACVRVPRGWMANERARVRRNYTRTPNVPGFKGGARAGKVGGTVITGTGRRIAPHYRPGSDPKPVTDGGRGGSLQPHCESPNAPLDDAHTDVGPTGSLASEDLTVRALAPVVARPRDVEAWEAGPRRRVALRG